METSVRILDGRVAVRLGRMRMSFPDEPYWWAVMEKTVEAAADLAPARRDDDAG